jgi:RimJ/RimL family protein N-acetyltransferase
MTAEAVQQPLIHGDGLTLRPWDEGLVRQLAAWGERGFPYNAFDLGYLRDEYRSSVMLSWVREEHTHRHFIACERDTAVGRVSVNLRDEAGLYLWAVHVPPEHEGRGVCRRMLSALIAWLEQHYPGREFVLTSNAFAERAHRAYFSLGFEIAETRWQFDKAIADQLWKVTPAEREPIAQQIRFQNGFWEVRTYVMRRRSGTPLPVRPTIP